MLNDEANESTKSDSSRLNAGSKLIYIKSGNSPIKILKVSQSNESQNNLMSVEEESGQNHTNQINIDINNTNNTIKNKVEEFVDNSVERKIKEKYKEEEVINNDENKEDNKNNNKDPLNGLMNKLISNIKNGKNEKKVKNKINIENNNSNSLSKLIQSGSGIKIHNITDNNNDNSNNKSLEFSDKIRQLYRASIDRNSINSELQSGIKTMNDENNNSSSSKGQEETDMINEENNINNNNSNNNNSDNNDNNVNNVNSDNTSNNVNSDNDNTVNINGSDNDNLNNNENNKEATIPYNNIEVKVQEANPTNNRYFVMIKVDDVINNQDINKKINLNRFVNDDNLNLELELNILVDKNTEYSGNRNERLATFNFTLEFLYTRKDNKNKDNNNRMETESEDENMNNNENPLNNSNYVNTTDNLEINKLNNINISSQKECLSEQITSFKEFISLLSHNNVPRPSQEVQEMLYSYLDRKISENRTNPIILNVSKFFYENNFQPFDEAGDENNYRVSLSYDNKKITNENEEEEEEEKNIIEFAFELGKPISAKRPLIFDIEILKVLDGEYNESGKESTEMYKGIRNEGNTCYMNTILQSIFHLFKLRNLILDIDLKDKDIENDRNSQIVLAIQKVFFDLYRSRYIDASYIVIGDFYEKLGESFGEWNEQQDIAEVMSLFNDIFTGFSNDIKKECEGKLLNRITVKEVNYSSAREEPFFLLPLEITGNSLLIECLDKFFSKEKLDRENQYEYDDPVTGNKIKYDAEKRYFFKEIPNILYINLKRFNYNFRENAHIKLNDLLIYDEVINLNKYVYKENTSNTTNDNIYILYSVLVHTGSFNGGHYYIYLRDLQKKAWVCYNDKNKDISERETVFEGNYGGIFEECNVNKGTLRVSRQYSNNSAYILIYIKYNVIGEYLSCDCGENFGTYKKNIHTLEKQKKEKLEKKILEEAKLRKESENKAIIYRSKRNLAKFKREKMIIDEDNNKNNNTKNNNNKDNKNNPSTTTKNISLTSNKLSSNINTSSLKLFSNSNTFDYTKETENNRKSKEKLYKSIYLYSKKNAPVLSEINRAQKSKIIKRLKNKSNNDALTYGNSIINSLGRIDKK